MPLLIEGEETIFLYQMYINWEKGISPREFRKNWMCDIRKVMAISDAIGQKNLKQSQINDMMNQVITRR